MLLFHCSSIEIYRLSMSRASGVLVVDLAVLASSLVAERGEWY